MVRRPTLALCVVLGLGVLTGCSGGGPYCDAARDGEDSLKDFGRVNSAAFVSSAKVTTAIAKEAPEDVREEWKAVAKATRGVVAAHRKADVRLQDMTKESTVNALSQDDLDRIQAANEAFNDTATQRRDLAQHLHDECGIDLPKK